MTTNEMRVVAGYHFGTDLAERLVAAQQFQKRQAEALKAAADRIDELEKQLAAARASQAAA